MLSPKGKNAMLSILFALMFACGDVKLDRSAAPSAIQLVFENTDGNIGCALGAYLGGRLAVTAPHVTQNWRPGKSWWASGAGETGTVKVLEKYGLLIKVELDRVPKHISPAKIGARPVNGQELHWLKPLTSGRYAFVWGRYVGVDAAGDMELDGVVWLGSSGSPLYDRFGNVVGIIDSTGGNDNALIRPMAYAIPWEK